MDACNRLLGVSPWLRLRNDSNYNESNSAGLHQLLNDRQTPRYDIVRQR